MKEGPHIVENVKPMQFMHLRPNDQTLINDQTLRKKKEERNAETK